MRATYYLILLLFITSLSNSYSQQVAVTLGNTTITENEFFTITLTVNNGKLNTYSNFPDIKGFIKYTTISNASATSNKIEKPLIITQQYAPLKVGKFKVNDFSMNINGVIIPVKGSNIVVNESVKSSIAKNTDEINEAKGVKQFKLPEELIAAKEPFLILCSTKNTVYVGEGFDVTLLFCIPEGNKTTIKFNDLGTQLTEIVKKVKPENCTQETVTLDSIQQGILVQGGKKISYYKLYETFFFPINNKKIELTSLSLTMLLNKKPNNKEEDNKPSFITYSSKPLLIEVKNLPPHPWRDLVAVGNYNLIESISTQKLKTGKSFNYIFTISGEGNINQLAKPMWSTTFNFEIFEPEIDRVVQNKDDMMTGSCVFNYFIIPHEPGVFGMKDYFKYIYFNTEKKRYDTLSSKLVLQVYGDSKHNSGESLNTGDSFYDLIKTESNFFISKNTKEVYILLAKVFILVLVVLLVILIIRI